MVEVDKRKRYFKKSMMRSFYGADGMNEVKRVIEDLSFISAKFSVEIVPLAMYVNIEVYCRGKGKVYDYCSENGFVYDWNTEYLSNSGKVYDYDKRIEDCNRIAIGKFGNKANNFDAVQSNVTFTRKKLSLKRQPK